MNPRHLFALALVTGLASQAQAFDSEHAVSQSLAGFGATASVATPAADVGPFRGEYQIGRDLAGFSDVMATVRGGDVRHAFRNEFDLTYGQPGQTASSPAMTDRAETPRVGFRGEYQINHDLAGFADTTARASGGDARYPFRNEYELTYGVADAAARNANVPAATGAGMHVGYRSEFEINRSLSGFPA